MSYNTHPKVVATFENGEVKIASPTDGVSVRTEHETPIVDGENAHRYTLTVTGDDVEFASVSRDSADGSDDGLTVGMEHRTWNKGGEN